jgi:hypothetical protein
MAIRIIIRDLLLTGRRIERGDQIHARVASRSTVAVKDFYDEDEVRRVYYPEAERLVAEATDASRVLVFDHTIRRRVAGGIDRSPGTPRQPVTSVHRNEFRIFLPSRTRARGQKRKPAASGGLPPRCQKWNSVIFR